MTTFDQNSRQTSPSSAGKKSLLLSTIHQSSRGFAMKKIVSVAIGLAVLIPSFAFAAVPATAEAASHAPSTVSAKPDIAKHARLEARIAHFRALQDKLIKHEEFLKSKGLPVHNDRFAMRLERIEVHLERLEKLNRK
jgi:hypothetical protein